MDKESIKNEIKRVEEDSLYSSKGHFVAAGRWNRLSICLGLPVAVLSAVGGASAFGSFDNHAVVAGVISIVVTVLVAANTFLDPGKKSQVHFQYGNNYNALRNKARILAEIKSSGLSSEELMVELETLNEQRDEFNSSAPQIPFWAFTKARAGIEEGQAEYKVDAK
jgi:hypothetical protein